jgi:hypothetical protein
VLLTSIAVVIVTFALPYTPLSGPLQLVPLPTSLLGLICLITLGYLVATELVKRVFWPRHARLTSATVPDPDSLAPVDPARSSHSWR